MSETNSKEQHPQHKHHKLVVLQAQTPVPDYLPSAVFLSDNSKTGVSVNTSIAQTCRPTKACAQYCYGLSGRIRLPSSLKKQAENTKFFAEAPALAIRNEAARVGHQVLGAGSKFLRMFGVGDLQPGSKRFVEAIADFHPKLKIWLSTRKPGKESLPRKHPSLTVMFSTDATSSPRTVREMLRIRDRRGGRLAGVIMSWTQQTPGEPVPSWVDVIFAKHVAATRAKWTNEHVDVDPRTCPATVREGADHDAACAKCMWCIDAGVRKRSRKGPFAAWLRTSPRRN